MATESSLSVGSALLQLGFIFRLSINKIAVNNLGPASFKVEVRGKEGMSLPSKPWQVTGFTLIGSPWVRCRSKQISDWLGLGPLSILNESL